MAARRVWKPGFVAAVGSGKSVREAAGLLGVSVSAYSQARVRDRVFAGEVDVARASRHVEREGLGGRLSFEGFAQRYFHMSHLPHQLRLVAELEALEPRSVTMFLLWPEAGKDLDGGTLIPTPVGFTKMCDLRVGDLVFAGDGSLTTVTGFFPQSPQDCYEVTFSGGSTVVAGVGHQWVVRSRSVGRWPSSAESERRRAEVEPWFPSGNNRPARVLTTGELLESGVTYGGDGSRPNHAVPVARPLHAAHAVLPVDPYLLGVWLGDGVSASAAIVCGDVDKPAMVEMLESVGVEWTSHRRTRESWLLTPCGLYKKLRLAGLLHNKHIPALYLRGASEDRMALLRGLMDTDGHCDKRGRCEFVTVKPVLRDGFRELLCSLGIKHSEAEDRARINGKDCGPRYRFQFVPRVPVFRLARKVAGQLVSVPNDRDRWRTIVDIRPVPSVPTYCITVDHPSHTYVFGEQMLVTHNTATIENYICKTLAEEPDHRFRVVSEASDLSKRIVGTCARRFTDASLYGEFVGRFGPFYESGQERHGRPWMSDQLTLLGSSGTERDRSLVASSWKSAVYGSRIDTLILDDLQSLRNMNEAETILKHIRGTFLTRGIEMRVLCVGTRIASGDFYDRMIEAGLVAKLVQVPATGAMGAAAGEPSVPEFWSKAGVHNGRGVCCPPLLRSCPADGSKVSAREFMEVVKFQVGEEAWEASYMQNPLTSGVYPFAQVVDRCLDKSRHVGEGVAA